MISVPHERQFQGICVCVFFSCAGGFSLVNGCSAEQMVQTVVFTRKWQMPPWRLSTCRSLHCEIAMLKGSADDPIEMWKCDGIGRRMVHVQTGPKSTTWMIRMEFTFRRWATEKRFFCSPLGLGFEPFNFPQFPTKVHHFRLHMGKWETKQS